VRYGLIVTLLLGAIAISWIRPWQGSGASILPLIAQEEQAHIFTPFYRGSANARFADGMGLGLSIAHDLVAAHGGRLAFMSKPGVGSQFTIWLPLA